MYYPEGMKAQASPVQSIEPHRILAPTRDLNQGHYITLHYITSFQTPITPTVTNGASTKSFKFSECELKKVSFQKFFEGISVCEFLKIGRKRIPCLRSGE